MKNAGHCVKKLDEAGEAGALWGSDAGSRFSGVRNKLAKKHQLVNKKGEVLYFFQKSAKGRKIQNFGGLLKAALGQLALLIGAEVNHTVHLAGRRMPCYECSGRQAIPPGFEAVQ